MGFISSTTWGHVNWILTLNAEMDQLKSDVNNSRRTEKSFYKEKCLLSMLSKKQLNWFILWIFFYFSLTIYWSLMVHLFALPFFCCKKWKTIICRIILFSVRRGINIIGYMEMELDLILPFQMPTLNTHKSLPGYIFGFVRWNPPLKISFLSIFSTLFRLTSKLHIATVAI